MITPIVVFLTTAAAMVPVASRANPLLSGYGGPGQGNQAILGSALLNGPSGGGSAGGGGASSSPGGSPRAAVASSAQSGSLPATPGTTAGAAGHTAGATRKGNSAARGLRGVVEASSGPSGAGPVSTRVVGARSAGTLGLSDQDLLAISLALAALALTTVLTARMARTGPTSRHGS